MSSCDSSLLFIYETAYLQGFKNDNNNKKTCNTILTWALA